MAPTFACPSCGFVVFDEERGSYDRCPVCDWENDGVRYADPNYWGGATEPSLVEEQALSIRRFPHGTWTVERWHRDPWWRPLMKAEIEAGPDAVTPPSDDETFVPYWSRSPLGFDTVLTNVWWDGPLGGIANLDGRPHYFHVSERGDELYDLWPVDAEMVGLELEALQIWYRWSAATPVGTIVTERYPALPGDRTRCDTVHAELERRREVLLAQVPAPIFALAVFQFPATPMSGSDTWFAVRWEIEP